MQGTLAKYLEDNVILHVAWKILNQNPVRAHADVQQLKRHESFESICTAVCGSVQAAHIRRMQGMQLGAVFRLNYSPSAIMCSSPELASYMPRAES